MKIIQEQCIINKIKYKNQKINIKKPGPLIIKVSFMMKNI